MKAPPTFERWLAETSPTFPWHYPYLRHVRGYLDRVTAGEINKLMVFLPPRHYKSEMMTVRYAAYRMEQRRGEQVIIGAYNQTLANRFSRKCRRIVEQRLPMSGDRTAVEEWETDTGSMLRAVGMGAGITGVGGSLIIIDDPVKGRSQAESLAMQERCSEWWTDEIYTRQEPDTQFILIMTRWHENDLAGYILSSEDGPNWTVVSLPAEAEENDPLGRQIGEALCPERFGTDKLAAFRSVLGQNYYALYQQRPTAAEGDKFKQDWFTHRYEGAPEEQRAACSFVIQSIDSAFKTGVENDYSVIATWGIRDNYYPLLDVSRKRLPFPSLIREMQDQAAKWQPHAILVEDAASGQSAIQVFQAASALPVIPVKVAQSKVARAEPITPLFESGRVLLPTHAPWVADFISEHVNFPNGAHDDQVDTTSMALNYLRNHTGTVNVWFL